MKKLIKESIVAAFALTSIVLFMAAAVITFYKLIGYKTTVTLFCYTCLQN
jgi:hypothetical protein